MEARDTLRKIAALPPEARTIVFDLIEALEKRYATQATIAKTGCHLLEPGEEITPSNTSV